MSSPHTQLPATNTARLDWLIVGHGALASLWAHHLAASSQPLALITRAKIAPSACILHADAPAKTAPSACILHTDAPGSQETTASSEFKSLTIDTQGGATQTREFTTYNWDNLHTQIHENVRILVMVKAWQLEKVIGQLTDAVNQAGCIPEAIILSHNGIGAAENLLNQKLRQGWPIFDLVTTHGAWRKHSHHTVHAGAGSSLIGPRNTLTDNSCMAPPLWFEVLAQALPPLTWEPDILVRRWHKLAINCAINPLATLAQQPNGVLLNSEYHADIRAICEEIAAVSDIVFGSNCLAADELEAQVHQVIAATQHNTCSMLQDVQSNNPTEIDYLNGYVAKLAEAFHVVAPVNQRLAHAIKQLGPDT